MNVAGWLLWGFLATMLLTIVMMGSTGLGLTRINLPFMLGTVFTPDRDRAKLAGFFVHLLDGWLFSLVYVAAFHLMHAASWWRGAILGLGHALVVLTAGMTLLPGLHPRMASERHGPELGGALEPPGFLALNYGVRTPVFLVLSHVIFGAVLGALYTL
jgi:hypothetical protein